MPSAVQLRDQIRDRVEAALGPGLPSPFAPRATRPPTTVPTGIAHVDALIGGVPRSSLTEISGPPSSGRTALELALLASLTAKGEACALVDAEDAFDPASAEAVGVDLRRLLWVRCGGLEQALRATDLLLGAGGFSAVVVDLAGIPPRTLRRVPLAYWFRFRRAVENTPTVLALVSEEPCARSSTSLALRLDAEGACWGETSVLSPFAFPLRTALSGAKGLRVNFAKDRNSKIENRRSKVESRNSKSEIRNAECEMRNSKSEDELRGGQFRIPELPPHARLLCGIRWRAEAVRNRNAGIEARNWEFENRKSKFVAAPDGRTKPGTRADPRRW